VVVSPQQSDSVTDGAPGTDHGASLLVPAEETERSRRRRERPAVLGRYPLLVLGAVCGAAGVGLLLSARISPIAVAIAAFGLTLIALGAALHLFLLRDRERWPEEVHAWDEGIEVVLHNQDVRAAAWTDPRLAFDIFVHRPGASSEESREFHWRMDSGVPACDLSQAGFDRIMKIVVERNLKLAEYRAGAKGKESRAYEIRGPLPVVNFDGVSAAGNTTITSP